MLNSSLFLLLLSSRYSNAAISTQCSRKKRGLEEEEDREKEKEGEEEGEGEGEGEGVKHRDIEEDEVVIMSGLQDDQPPARDPRYGNKPSVSTM